MRKWPLPAKRAGQAFMRACVIAVLLLGAADTVAATAGEREPLEVVREHVGTAIAVLQDPSYRERNDAQRERLCAIAHQLFDIETFSRLVLMARWKELDRSGQAEFVNVFGDFLCRYYLSRLQLYYGNEQVDFTGQEIKSDTRATVRASVSWQGLDIPVEVRMSYRKGRWRAFDVVVSGISAVLVYRAQFQPRLINEPAASLIDELRQRIAEQG